MRYPSHYKDFDSRLVFYNDSALNSKLIKSSYLVIWCRIDNGSIVRMKEVSGAFGVSDTWIIVEAFLNLNTYCSAASWSPCSSSWNVQLVHSTRSWKPACDCLLLRIDYWMLMGCDPERTACLYHSDTDHHCNLYINWSMRYELLQQSVSPEFAFEGSTSQNL